MTDERDIKLVSLHPDEDLVGMRIDKYLADELDDYSRSYLAKLIDEGRVTVISGSAACCEKPVKA